MSLGTLFSRLLGRAPQAPASGAAPGRAENGKGFLVFHHTGEVIAAESLLRGAGLAVEVKGPPPELRTGCDMVLVFDLLREPEARRLLEAADLVPLQAVPVLDPLLEPVSLFQYKDFGPWFMVRAANMKVTVERATGRIVNVSGGGCPDVPYLAAKLTGQRVTEAEEPRIKGRTLCSFALQKAFEEARRLWHG